MFQEKYEVYKSLERQMNIVKEELETFLIKRMQQYFLIVENENVKELHGKYNFCERIDLETANYYREKNDTWGHTAIPIDYIFLEEDEWQNYLNERLVEKNKKKELTEIKNRETMLNEYNNLKKKLGL
jgi:hypothetical protein